MTADRVYVKTAKGIEELTRQTSRLPENVLAILHRVDGIRAMNELMPEPRFAYGVPESIETLLAGNYIAPSGCDITTQTTQPIPAPDPLADAKRFMTQALRDTLGPDADRQIRKVERAADRESLRKIGLSHLRGIHQPGNRKQAEAFRDGLLHLALIGDDEAHITPANALAPHEDIRHAQRTMCRLMSEALGPDADRFNLRIERTRTAAALRTLLAKYQDVVRSVGGRSKAEAFVQSVSAALEAPQAKPPRR